MQLLYICKPISITLLFICYIFTLSSCDAFCHLFKEYIWCCLAWFEQGNTMKMRSALVSVVLLLAAHYALDQIKRDSCVQVWVWWGRMLSWSAAVRLLERQCTICSCGATQQWPPATRRPLTLPNRLLSSASHTLSFIGLFPLHFSILAFLNPYSCNSNLWLAILVCLNI